ncbi:integrase arm-type DNA-binding domain-containing protein [Granulicella sp. L60]|uniref:tyrosine-type recombinase/integrase n=1 Tax=Granulicella sp. L60 TaxID=1641866 RepID=UPI00131CE777|nr:integrase arm-type DNA-binding domain-containing protein [Granulicella sp. L60]
MELTVREIETAKPTSKQYKLADGKGLCLLVMPSGAKYWRWRYRFEGIEKMMSLGEYPEVGLKEARERLTEARKLWSSGIDPLAERKAAADAKLNKEREEQRKVENSFESVARAWWAWWKVGKSPRHAETVILRLEADVFPAYGHKDMETVTPSDIRDVMLGVEGRGSRDVARRIHETTGQIFRYAIAHGKATRNPAADFKPRDILLQVKSENFARVDVKDLPELLAKMDDYWGDAITRFALKLVAYTFVRTSELIEAPWPEFDLDNALWVIPAERMKMGTMHIVPLSRQAVEVLRALKLLTGNGRLLFPGAMDKTKPMSNNTILGALYRLGYKDRMTGHGFRGLASTILNENDFDEAHVEMQLAHLKRNKVAAAYNHAKYLKQRTMLMQWWADHLDGQLALGRRSLAA